MIAEQDGRTDRDVRVEAAGRVREHDDAAAGEHRGTHAVHDRVRGMAFVQVRPTREHEHRAPLAATE